MVSNFPEQVDSFPIHLAEEVIKSADVNNIQDSIVAVQIFSTEIEAAINDHVIQASGAHASTAISIADITDVATGNLQLTLEDLKVQIDAVDAANVDAYEFADHINNDYIYTDPHPALSITVDPVIVSTYSNVYDTLAALYTGILALEVHPPLDIETAHGGQLPLNRIDDYTQIVLTTDLSAHTSLDIETAHSGQLLGSRITNETITNDKIVDGTIEESKLAFSLATQAELDTHIADTMTHGTSSDIVGYLDTGILENKTILSDFIGSKVVMWNESVLDEEKTIFNDLTTSANPVEVRFKSVALFTPSGVVSGDQTITVADGTLFESIVGVTNALWFKDPYSVSETYATILSRVGNVLTLDGIPVIPSGAVAVNTQLAAPAFAVDPDGSVVVSNLHVTGDASLDIDFDDDVTINGDLNVAGSSNVDDDFWVGGTINVAADAYVGTSLEVGTSITVPQLSAADGFFSNNVSIGNDAAITNNINIGNDANIFGDTTLDGYVTIGSYTSILDSVHIADNLTIGCHLSVGCTLEVAQDASFSQGIFVSNDAYVGGGLFVDGYSNINNNLSISGDLTVSGSIISSEIQKLEDHIDGYGHKHYAEAIIYDGYHLFESILYDTDDVQEAIEDLADGYTILKDQIETLVGNDGFIFDTSGMNITNAIDIKTAVEDIDAYVSDTRIELDTLETSLGSMINNDGTFDIFAGTNYIDGYTDVTEVIEVLDEAIFNATVIIEDDGYLIESTAKTINLGSNLEAISSGTNRVTIDTTSWQEIAASPGSAIAAGSKYMADATSNPISIILPSGPVSGDTVKILDPTSSWGTNNLTLVPSGSDSVNGAAAPLAITVPNHCYELVYYAATTNWIIIRTPATYGGS